MRGERGVQGAAPRGLRSGAPATPASGGGPRREPRIGFMREADLRRRLDALYIQYDPRFVDPDPLQFVRAQKTPADREAVGLLASSLPYGNVAQIKQSIPTVLALLRPRHAEA